MKHGASHHIDDEKSEDHWNCFHRKTSDLETWVRKNSFVACSWKGKNLRGQAVDVLVRSDNVLGRSERTRRCNRRRVRRPRAADTQHYDLPCRSELRKYRVYPTENLVRGTPCPVLNSRSLGRCPWQEQLSGDRSTSLGPSTKGRKANRAAQRRLLDQSWSPNPTERQS